MKLADIVKKENEKRSVGTNQRNELLAVITSKGLEDQVVEKIEAWEEAKQKYEEWLNAEIEKDKNNMFFARNRYAREYGKDAVRFAESKIEDIMESFVDRYAVIVKVDPATIDWIDNEVTVYDGYDLQKALKKLDEEQDARLVKNNGEK